MSINDPLDDDLNEHAGEDAHREQPDSPMPEARLGLDFGAGRLAQSRKVTLAVRFRIFTLVLLLMAVIFAMKEAGKPERWMWMGFDQPSVAVEADDLVVDAGSDNGSIAAGGPEDWVATLGPTPKGSEADGAGVKADAKIVNQRFDNRDAREFDERFWHDAYESLSADSQLPFFQLLRKISRSQLGKPDNVSLLEKIVKRIAKKQENFQTLALTTIALVPDERERKRQTEALFDFDRRWRQQVSPTLLSAIAGEDFSFAGQIEIKKVFAGLRPIFLDAVEDRTGMGTRGDLRGWLTVWDQAIHFAKSGKENAASEIVSFLQLSAQPEIYRGKQVTVAGQARTCRKKVLAETQLPVDSYYETWIEPTDDDGDGVLCVYSAQIPSSFPTALIDNEVGKFQSLDETVLLSGVFFKVRSYRDLGGGVSHSPVVIAKQIGVVNSLASASSATVPPELKSTVVWFMAIAVFAVGAAVIVFRSAATHKRRLGQSSARRMQLALEALEDDPNVKSPMQRVAELAEDGETHDD